MEKYFIEKIVKVSCQFYETQYVKIILNENLKVFI